MSIFKRTFPTVLAILFGVVTLLGILILPGLEYSGLGNLLLSWGSFLAAVALLLGVANLFFVHARRMARNGYSAVLVLVMIVVFVIAAADALTITNNLLDDAFDWIQRPLEASLASLLAFFLLFAGYRLLQRKRDGWAVLFLAIVIISLLAHAALPGAVANIIVPLYDRVTELFVTAGMRGILIGVALGAITISIRLITGSERPYNK